MKQLLIICMMLTASVTYSQETFQITPEQAKEAIKAKQRVLVLESALRAQGLIVNEYKLQVQDITDQLAIEARQTDLWKKNYELIQTRLEAEKEKKPKNNTFVWILRCVGAFGVGYFLGSVAN